MFSGSNGPPENRQADVADLVGRTTNTVSRWELGTLVPDPLVQQAVVAVLTARRIREQEKQARRERAAQRRRRRAGGKG